MARYNTPLRYPGGKQKLTNFVVQIIKQNDLIGCDYVEPYAGGAGVAIELLLRGFVSNVHLNDINPAVFSFWHTVKNKPEELCRKISMALLNVEEWKKQREIIRFPDQHDKEELAFAFLYLNRCNHSGIISGGLIGGLDQTGKWKMDARFPRNEIIRRIELIAKHKKQIRIRNLDAERYVICYLPRLGSNSLIYYDPPYFNKADKLYYDHYTKDDHVVIANVIQKYTDQPWIVSYDNCEQIRHYYRNRRYITYNLQYNAQKAYKGTEIFIFSDIVKIPRQSEIKYIEEVVI